ncbi:hypothetical protein [Methanoculleus sp.]|nr:hypothetical protein [Methanoculleus sp.]MCK9319680.1 hypothetical protein [Methanoculleus sp.]
MKGSFTQARAMVLNSSGKERCDKIKYDDKVCSLVHSEPHRGHEVKEVYV